MLTLVLSSCSLCNGASEGDRCRNEWSLYKGRMGSKAQRVQEDLMNKSPILLKHNPIYKKVPVLVHNNKPIADSLSILEYIDEKWKHNPLLPQDPHDRATARFWAKFSDDKCMIDAFGACKAVGEEKEKAIECAQESLLFLEKQIEGKKFFGGEEIGFLDLAVGWIPHWLDVMEEVGEMKLLDPNKLPWLHQWARDFIQISIIKECLPPRDKLVHHFIATISYVSSLDANK